MKLLVVIPYRDRKGHLDELLSHLPGVLSDQGIDHSIVVVEQSAGKPFNRGMICNIGFDLFSNGHDYVCFHDVDMICSGMDFSYTKEPVCLLSSRTKNEIYKWYFGGVVAMSCADFKKANGFSNEYWGWGCEDNDLFKRLRGNGLKVGRRGGSCLDLEMSTNEQNRKANKKYKENKKRLDSFSMDISRSDGLNNLKGLYDVEYDLNEATHRIAGVKI